MKSRAGGMSEVELKLGFPRAMLRTLEAHPRLAAARVGPPRRRMLVSTYHDTPDEALRRAGAALRVRRDGRRWVQTLKTAGTAVGGLHTREEAEWVVPRDAIVAAHVTERLAAMDPPVDVAALRPAFVTRFRRTAFDVDLGGGTIAEVAIDVGAVEARGRSATLCEMEIELRTGDPTRLFDFAIALAADVPFTVRMPSKAERGYALGRSSPGRPAREEVPVLDRSAPAGAALGTLLAFCLAGMQAHEAGVAVRSNPESLHRFRVAARRLRALLALVPAVLPAPRSATRPDADPAPVDVLKGDLRWLFGEIGPARDADVWCDALLPRIAGSMPDGFPAEAVQRASRRLRVDDRARARAAVAAPRYVALQLRVGRLVVLLAQADASLEGDAAGRDAEGALPRFRDAATALLRKRWSAVRKRDPLTGTPEERHAARIAVKKLRYLVELTGDVPGRPRRRRRLERRLAAVQDVLGRANDARVATRILERLARVTRPPDPVTIAAIRAWLAGYDAGVVAALAPAWTRLVEAKRCW